MCDEGQEKQCAICWENLNPSQSSVLLGCSHRFHYKCLAEWAKRSSQCPMCREPFQEEPATDGDAREDVTQEEIYVDFNQLHHLHSSEQTYWWQVAGQGVALLSTSITILRFLALLFPGTVQRIFHPQIQAGKQLQTYFFSYLRRHLGAHLPTILLAACLCCYPLTPPGDA